MILSEPEREFALSQRVGHLATADAAGVPHVIPICFAVQGERIYSVIDEKPKASRSGLKRLRNIAANSHVAVIFDRYDDEDWSRLAFLRIQGTARVVAEAAEYAAALALLRGRYRQYAAMAISFPTHPMIAIRIARSHFWSAATRG